MRWRRTATTWGPVVVLGALVVGSELNAELLTEAGGRSVRWLVLGVVWLAPLVLYVGRSTVLLGVLDRPPLRAPACWLLWTVLAAGWSVASPTGLALVTAVGLVSCWLCAVWFVSVHGWDRFVWVLACTTLVFLVLAHAWAVVGDPASAWVGPRMAGIAWSPTALGRVGGLAVVLGALVLARQRASGPGAAVGASRAWVGGACVVLGLDALVLSATVTAALGLVVAGATVLWRVGRRAVAVIVSVSTGAVAVVALILSSRAAAATVDGTGDLTNATGRVEIWASTLPLVARAPVLGHGTGSGEAVYDDLARSGDLAWRAFTAHNSLLHVLLTQGLVGAVLLVAVAVAYVRATRRARDVGRDALVVFLFVESLTEALVEQASLSVVVLAGALAAAANDAARRPVPDDAPVPVAAVVRT